MVGLTREQRRTKNRKMLADQVKNSAMYQHFKFDDTVAMVEEMEQELLNLLPKKANPKLKQWAINAVCYGGGHMFFLEIHVLRNIDQRPYLTLRRIRIHDGMKNNGYATAILKILIAKSKQYGYDGVEIESVGSPIMAHVAEKMGFSRLGETQNYILTFNRT